MTQWHRLFTLTLALVVLLSGLSVGANKVLDQSDVFSLAQMAMQSEQVVHCGGMAMSESESSTNCESMSLAAHDSCQHFCSMHVALLHTELPEANQPQQTLAYIRDGQAPFFDFPSSLYRPPIA